MNYHLTVQDIMQTDVSRVAGEVSVQQAVLQMRDAGTRSLLVSPSQKDKPYGIISYSDIVYQVLAEEKNAAQISVDEVATDAAYAVHAHDTVQAVARHFKRFRIGHAPVVDTDGNLIGVVSMTDLITEAISEPE